MFALALEVLINEAMSNHCYTFNGQIKLQSKGGAIGNVLTGALGALTMVRFTRELKEKLAYAMQDNPDFVLHLLRIYVDDKNVITTVLPPGSRLIDGKLHHSRNLTS